MVSTGDAAPDFTVPLVDDDIAPFTLSEHVGEGPLVLAFFPGAFTGACTTEMGHIQDDLGAFEDVGATVYGVSVDTPFSLQEFREQEDLSFGLLSDHAKDVVEAYDLAIDFEDYGYYGLADRAVVVVDTDGEVSYVWVADDPGQLPDLDAVREAAADAA
jgi:peroxiredoxin